MSQIVSGQIGKKMLGQIGQSQGEKWSANSLGKAAGVTAGVDGGATA